MKTESANGPQDQCVDRTAPSLPTNEIAKDETQPQAAPTIRNGMFADLGGSNTCSTQVAASRPSLTSAKDQTQGAAPGYIYAVLDGLTPANRAPTPNATTVDREVDEIISDVNREVAKLNENDNFYSTEATFALNEGYKRASSKLAKQKLLEHPETQKLIDRIVTTAIGLEKDGTHWPFVALDSIIENKTLDPALKDALLKRIFKDDTLINLLRDSMSPEEQNALDDLLAKEKSKELPREIQLVSLCQISLYPNKMRVISNLELLIKKQEFLNPHDRKFALVDQRTLVETIAYAAGHDGYRPTLDHDLDRILSPELIVKLDDLKNRGGENRGRVVTFPRRTSNRELGLRALPHEIYHADDPKIVVDGRAPYFKDEIGAWICEYLADHKHLPSPKEVYKYISDHLLKDEIYKMFWKPSKNGDPSVDIKERTHVVANEEIAQVVGNLVGLKQARPPDISLFDWKSQNKMAHLSTEPMSLKDIKDWLGEEYAVRLYYREPSKPLSQGTVDDWLSTLR